LIQRVRCAAILAAQRVNGRALALVRVRSGRGREFIASANRHRRRDARLRDVLAAARHGVEVGRLRVLEDQDDRHHDHDEPTTSRRRRAAPSRAACSRGRCAWRRTREARATGRCGGGAGARGRDSAGGAGRSGAAGRSARRSARGAVRSAFTTVSWNGPTRRTVTGSAARFLDRRVVHQMGVVCPGDHLPAVRRRLDAGVALRDIGAAGRGRIDVAAEHR